MSEAGWNSVIVVQLLGTLGDQEGHDEEDNDADSGYKKSSRVKNKNKWFVDTSTSTGGESLTSEMTTCAYFILNCFIMMVMVTK